MEMSKTGMWIRIPRVSRKGGWFQNSIRNNRAKYSLHAGPVKGPISNWKLVVFSQNLIEKFPIYNCVVLSYQHDRKMGCRFCNYAEWDILKYVNQNIGVFLLSVVNFDENKWNPPKLYRHFVFC